MCRICPISPCGLNPLSFVMPSIFFLGIWKGLELIAPLPTDQNEPIRDPSLGSFTLSGANQTNSSSLSNSIRNSQLTKVVLKAAEPLNTIFRAARCVREPGLIGKLGCTMGLNEEQRNDAIERVQVIALLSLLGFIYYKTAAQSEKKREAQ